MPLASPPASSPESLPPPDPLLRIVYENTWRDQFRFSAVHQFLSVKLQAVTLLSVLAIVLFYASERGLATQITLFAEIFVAFWIFQLLVTAVYLHSSRNKSLLTRRVLELRPDALRVESRYSQSFYYWSGIDRAVSHPGYIAIYLNAHLAEVIPDRAFASAGQRAGFLATAVERIARARARGTPDPDVTGDRPGLEPDAPASGARLTAAPPPVAPPGDREQALAELAHQAMHQHGLLVEFPAAALGQATEIDPLAEARNTTAGSTDLVDLTGLPWCSIAAAGPCEAEALLVSQPVDDALARVLVAVIDVDSLVARGSPIDDHARQNTLSIFTAAGDFPMLPARLSTDLVTFRPGSDRLAIVCEMIVASDASIVRTTILRARVRNHARLGCDDVSAWLARRSAMPGSVAAIVGLDDQLRCLDALAAQRERRRIETDAPLSRRWSPNSAVAGGNTILIGPQARQRARRLTKEWLITAEVEFARFLGARQRTFLRRSAPCPAPAEGGRSEDGWTAVGLVGGDPVVARPAVAEPGAASPPAPDRFFSDLVGQRLLKAALRDERPPYDDAELAQLAAHCNRQAAAAAAVERDLRTAVAARLDRDGLAPGPLPGSPESNAPAS